MELSLLTEKNKAIISQIHEPQNVVVPNLIGKWLNACKTSCLGGQLSAALQGPGESFNDSEAINIWLEYPENQETFARAWLDGYEVESDQLYTVEIPDPNRPDTVTFLYKENGKVFLGSDIFLDEVPNYKWKKEPENQLTESEIKQDFGWAWQFAKEVE